MRHCFSAFSLSKFIFCVSRVPQALTEMCRMAFISAPRRRLIVLSFCVVSVRLSRHPTGNGCAGGGRRGRGRRERRDPEHERLGTVAPAPAGTRPSTPCVSSVRTVVGQGLCSSRHSSSVDEWPHLCYIVVCRMSLFVPPMRWLRLNFRRQTVISLLEAMAVTCFVHCCGVPECWQQKTWGVAWGWWFGSCTSIGVIPFA